MIDTYLEVKEMNKKSYLYPMLMVVALFASGLACSSSSDDSEGVRTLLEESSDDNINEVENGENEVIQATNTPLPTPTEAIVGLIEEGTHLVGTDIDPGIYVGLAGEGLFDSCYWARLSGLTGELGDILANENAEGLFYVEILASDKALKTDCELLPLAQVPQRAEFLTIIPTGMYIVGRDIQPGTYRGEGGNDILSSCYWARLRNVSGDNNILANDNATGQFFIEILPTDFALKVGCNIELIE